MRQTKVIALVSGKGGVGKTVLTAALGMEGTGHGRVILVDLGFGVKGLDLLVEASYKTGQLPEYLAATDLKTAKECLWETGVPGCLLLSSPQTGQASRIDRLSFWRGMKDLREMADLVVIDVPSGNGDELSLIAGVCDEVLLVAEPTALSLRAADRVKSMLSAQGMHRQTLLMSRVRKGQTIREKLKDAEDLLGLVPFAVFPEEEELGQAVEKDAFKTWLLEKLSGDRKGKKKGADPWCGELLALSHKLWE